MMYEHLNSDGKFELAMKYIYGDGVEEDNEKAVMLLESAAAEGHVEASYNLGICYHYGYGVEIDLRRAFELYLKSAEVGYGKGMELVGRFFNRGIYVAKDRSTALEWLNRAVSSGDPEAASEAKLEIERVE